MPSVNLKPGDNLYSVSWNVKEGRFVRSHVVESVGRKYIYESTTRDKIDIATLLGQKPTMGSCQPVQYFLTQAEAEQDIQRTVKLMNTSAMISTLYRESYVLQKKSPEQIDELHAALKKFING
ncbi:MAG: beta barrel domain-containing protein [Giesbergeria sp.]